MTQLSRQVNLIADKLAYREAIKKQAGRIIGHLVAYVIIGLAICSATGIAATRVSSHLADVRTEIKELRQEHSRLQNLQSRVDESRAVAKWAVAVRNDSQRSHAILLELIHRMPNDMFLNDISLSISEEGREVKMSGTALSLEDIATFMGNLSRPRDFGTVALESTEVAELDGVSVVNFKCSITLDSSGAP